MILFLLKLVVYLVQIFDPDPMGDHFQRLNLTRLDLLEQIMPVEMDWRLAVANEADASLHQTANVEMVRVAWSRGTR